jgi:hypothetical protein
MNYLREDLDVAFSETQLNTWANLPSSQQFTDTYASVKNVLESTKAPYFGKRTFKVHLQGSYRNDTNIYGTGDVDIVACSSDTWGYNIDDLPQDQKNRFMAELTPGVTSACGPFKTELFNWLGSYYGYADVHLGNKTIILSGSGSRRKSDILACTDYRHYYRYAFSGDTSFHPGIRFQTANGLWIVNYPKQHYKNCAAKSSDTNNWFKPTARIFKNIRNRMINENIISEDLVSSYYIEGMLWNVPKEKYGVTFVNTVANCLNHLREVNKTTLLCANGIIPLVADSRPDAISPANFDSYIAKTIAYWNAA